ncbi:hypothetical protein GGI12_005046 [Dipsacomyces acuminosporus]|nr:hypothetical protein GGI12_005046 [Dipsacomyces acuminosporus]
MSNTATTQAPDLSTLLESINQAIAQNDEPEPAANPEHIERLERAVQLLESSLNSNTQLMQTAVAGISQVTEAISNHGNLLASLHTRQQQTWDSIQLMQNAMERLQAQVLSQVNLQAQTNSLIASQMQTFNLPSGAPATPFAQSPPTANAASTSGTIGAAASPTPNSHGLYTAASSPALTSAITVARSQMSPVSSPKSEAAVASDRQSRRDSSVRIDESANRYYKDAGSRYSSSRRSPSRESNWSSGSSSSRHSYSRNAPQEGFSIKGRSKHALNDSDSSDNRSSKRGCTSPRLNHIIMFGSDGENSESDSESDGGIAGRLSRPSAPRSSDRGERDIGIVGASSNRNNSSYNSHSGNARGQRGGSDINSRLDYSRSQSRFFDEHGSSNEARRLYSSTYRPPERNSGATLAPRDEISTIATTITTPPRLATVIRPMDGNGNEITAERINTVMGPFFFMRLMVVTHVYRLFFDCQALIPNVRQDDFNRSITSLAGFGYWQASARDSSGMSRVMSHYVLRSSADVEYERMKRRMDIKLFKSSVIPEPLLLYYMLTMTCCKLKEIEVEVIATMFFKITGRRVETLDVATKDGVQRMPLRKLWERLSDWAIELCKFIADKTLVQDSLDQADRCYDAYITNCRRCGSNTGSRSLELDPSGSTACKMLLDDEADSRLLLGIRSDELRRINRYLVYMMGELVPPRTIRYLKQVSESFIQNG